MTKDKIELELQELIGDEDKADMATQEQIDEFREDHKVKVAESKYKLEQLELSIKEDEEQIEEFKKDIKVHDSLIRLKDNPDFINFIEAYFIGEKERISDMLVAPQAFDNNANEQFVAKLNGIRHFKLFLKAVSSRAFDARTELEMKQLNIDVIKEVIEDGDYEDSDNKAK